MIWPDVLCVHCGAEPGQPCTTETHHRASQAHSTRQGAATARTRELVKAGIGDLSFYRTRQELRAQAAAL